MTVMSGDALRKASSESPFFQASRARVRAALAAFGSAWGGGGLAQPVTPAAASPSTTHAGTIRRNMALISSISRSLAERVLLGPRAERPPVGQVDVVTDGADGAVEAHDVDHA